MSGEWPPDWEDPDEGVLSDADQSDPETSARLSELSARLAAVPAPVMPDGLEARISAAIAAEAASRSAAEAGLQAAGEARTLERRPGRAQVRRNRIRRAVQVSGTLVVCLLFAGLGFVVSHVSPQSSSSSAASASQALGSEGAAPAAEPTSRSYAAGGDVAPASPSFTVTESGTSYQQATLAAQVHAAVAVDLPGAVSGSAAASSAGSTAGSSATAPRHAPTAALRGCVLQLTGEAQPELVDRATYQGTPAYIIATSSRVWVTGLGCSAAKPELIVSVPLAG